MKYIYGIIEVAAGKTWPVHAAERWGVETVRQGNIEAVIREVEDEAVKAGKDEILHHEEVIELVMGQQTILPARFGTVLPDTRAVIAVLKKYYSRFQDLLKELADKVEMGVRVIWQPPAKETRKGMPVTEPGPGPVSEPGPEAISEPGPEHAPTQPASGRAYLLAKYHEYQVRREWGGQGQAIIRGIHESVSPLAVKWRLSKQTSPALLFSGVYLIAKDQVEVFRERCRSLPQRYPEVKFLCSGPWPPYSFAQL